MEILTWTWSGDLEYETLRNALADAVPVKVLAGANLTLRAETADGGSDQMQKGGVESSRGTVVCMDGVTGGSITAAMA